MDKIEKKSILVLEDNAKLRKELVQLFERRSFVVYAAENTVKADEVLSNVADVDVLILDMELIGDPKTGAQYGLELRSQNRFPSPPECMIYSANTSSSYYQQAISLGVAAYLDKGELSSGKLISHVRILCLRRALTQDHSLQLKRARTIAATSGSTYEAMARLCEDIMVPELVKCIANPFCLLFTAPEGNHLYASTGSILLDGEEVTRHPVNTVWSLAPEEKELFSPDLRAQQFKEASFVSLYQSEFYSLSLGFINVDYTDENPFPDEAGVLAEICSIYLQPSIVSQFLYLVDHSRAISEGIMLGAARLCTQVGQQMTSAFRELQLQQGGTSSLPKPLRKLWRLGHELAPIGITLDRLSSQKPGSRLGFQSGDPIDAHDLVDHVWQELIERKEADVKKILKQDLVSFPIRKSSQLWACIHRIVGWMLKRALEEKADTKRQILTSYKQTETFFLLGFEDRSERLPSALRDTLLQPLLTIGEEGNGDNEAPLFETSGEVPSFLGILAKQSLIDGKKADYRLSLLPESKTGTVKVTFEGEDKHMQLGPFPVPSETLSLGNRLGLYEARAIAQANGGSLCDCTEQIKGTEDGHKLVITIPKSPSQNGGSRCKKIIE